MGIVVFGATFVDIKGYPITQYISGGRNVGRVIQVHGGVGRNVAEDIANIELKPTFITVLDNSGISSDVLDKLKRHNIDTRYIQRVENGLGTWLAIFDNSGDVIASISSRPDLGSIASVLEEHGDEIFAQADSVVLEIDMEVPLVKRIFELAERHGKEVYAVVSNMSIAVQRRDLLQRTGCIVCNQQEAGMLFSEDYEGKNPEEMCQILERRIKRAKIPRMIVTMGAQGAVYAQQDGYCGICPAQKVDIIDTTGAGDSFFAGVAIGLTYGKSLMEACRIGTRLACSVIATKESVCPRFLPEEFDLERR
jgi:pseudouridine kinase